MKDDNRVSRWSEVIRRKYKGKCPHCGKEGSAHHIIPRGCIRTLWVVQNGIYACIVLHRRFEGKEGEKMKQRMIKIYIGYVLLGQLEMIKNRTAKLEDFGFSEVK